MPVYQQPLWGYQITYPEGWIHETQGATEAFAARLEALDSAYQGPDAGHILVSAEWNSARRPVEPLWSRHIGRLSSLIGARQVGAAPWRLFGASGLEAEILLPKQDPRRVWSGILSWDFLVLKFFVLHFKEDRPSFEPLATRLISSLRLLNHVPGTDQDPDGLPLPPGYAPTQASAVISDIDDPRHWSAYTGAAGVDALQAFFLREAPAHGWSVEEYLPFPAPSGLGFARFRLTKAGKTRVLGILPSSEGGIRPDSPGSIVIKEIG